ncbi:unnamed protein product [Triticum turgidum subsp. durum]|uniref:Uncharacterized protein n=1 Tax=Triticum turgidum subsp. durum TaxID=4567 RepID=A0A9R1PGD3_TRITD|nr:unnamed protein product [Triticum turgidum subsp. durum]
MFVNGDDYIGRSHRKSSAFRPALPLAGDEVPVGRDQLFPEPRQVEPHVLPVQVHLLGHVPAALRHAGGVRQHGVARGVLAGQGALLRQDLVPDVPQAEARRRLAVVLVCRPVRAQRHHLDEHLAGAHEQEVRHGGAVHAHHRVARVQVAVYLAHLRAPLRPDHAHVEPHVRGQRLQLLLVLDHAGPRPRHDHQLRPLRRRRQVLVREGELRGGGAAGAALLAGGLALHALQVVDAGAVGVVEEAPEVADAPALGGLGGVHGELAVDAEAGDHLGEAVHAAIGGEVDGRERRQPGHDVAVLGHPPAVVLDDDEHHAALEVARRHEHREEAVVELVVHVAREPARGEQHGRHVVPHVAARGVAGGHAVEAHLVDGLHHVRLPLARVRPYPLLLLHRRSPGGGHELERRARRVHAQVAAREAHIRAPRRAVAAQGVVADPGAPLALLLLRGRRRAAGAREGEEGARSREERGQAEKADEEQAEEAAQAERPALGRLAVLAGGASGAVVMVVVHDPAAAALGRRGLA